MFLLDVQCEKKFPLRFSAIFPKRLRIFSPNFTHLLYVPIYAGLQIFIQLPATWTKLCHIKRDHHHMLTRKLCYRKDDREMRPTYGCPEHFRDSLTTPPALLPTFSWAFVPINPMNVPTKFEVRSFTRSWDNRGYPKNGQSLDTPTLPFLEKF